VLQTQHAPRAMHVVRCSSGLSQRSRCCLNV